MWVQRLQRSKIFISFLVALVLVFSYEVNKSKAVAPLILWGAGVVGSVVLEETVEMGVKWGSKELAKKKTDDLAKTIWNGGVNDLDLTKTKPKKNSAGDVIITPSAKDRAKIAGRVADVFDDIIEESDARKAEVDKGWIYVDDGSTTDNPMYCTNVGVSFAKESDDPADIMAMDFFRMNVDTELIPVPYHKKAHIDFESATTGSSMVGLTSLPYLQDRGLPGCKTYNVKVADYDSPTGAIKLIFYEGGYYHYFYHPTDSTLKYASFLIKDPVGAKTFEEYKRVLAEYGKVIYMAQGFVVPETIKNVYRYPTDRDIPDTYPIPNKQHLENRPIVIKDMLPDDLTLSGEVEIEWSEIENNYDNETEIINHINTNNGTYLENGDINNTTYNTTVINNYYTDIDNETKVIDVETDSQTWEDNDTTLPTVPGDSDDDLPTGPRPDPVETLDRSVLDVMVKSYEFFDDAIDATVISMKSVVDGAGGIVTFLDESMDWLPSEWRAVFVSTFLLGVFAHFFRR